MTVHSKTVRSKPKGWCSKHSSIEDDRALFIPTDCVFQIGNYIVEVRDGFQKFEILVAHIGESKACFIRMVEGEERVIPTILHALKSLGVKT